VADEAHRDPEALLRLNRALDEQVKTLVKTEQRLFLSQRDLSRKNARLDALNDFAIDSAALDDPAAVLARAAGVLFSIFSLDQAVGFIAKDDDVFEPVTALTREGWRPKAADLDGPARCVPPREPMVGTFEALRARSDLEPLLSMAERIFADDPVQELGTTALFLPLHTQGGASAGVLVLRRATIGISFHEELPTSRDSGFLGVLARLAAVNATNARLLHDLKISYAQLAQAQRELVDRERLAALGEFAAIVAHEVRNPVGAIFNAMSLLRRQVQSDEATRLLDIVGEESERLDRIVGDLLDFARPHPPRLRPERLMSIVGSAVDGVRASIPGAAISVVGDETQLDVWADARMLRQAVINLLVNAVQASAEAAPIDLRVASKEGRRVRISVADRGGGVPEALAARIFEPFFTTKATGTGLGLAVVKRVADSHGGAVTYAPREGGGSVFAISIPVEPEPTSPLR
jgi:signal transduction histidine kinase